MSNWYDKYLSIYGKPFSEVPQQVIDETRERLAALQSEHPVASIVVIGYNEETHLQACLWAISEIRCKYPVEIIGVDNDSKDRTAEIYRQSGIPYYTEYQHSCGYARRCGLQHARGKYYFDVDSDTLYPPQYYELMLEQLMKPGVVAVSATWSYFPDANHSKFGLKMFEMCRDLFLWIQHFKRPERARTGLRLRCRLWAPGGVSCRHYPWRRRFDGFVAEEVWPHQVRSRPPLSGYYRLRNSRQPVDVAELRPSCEDPEQGAFAHLFQERALRRLRR